MLFIPLSDDNPLRYVPYPWMTVGLIAANIAVFAWQSIQPTVWASFGLVPNELAQVGIFGGSAYGPNDTIAVPEVYTLLSYMFLHADFLHLASNMIFLWVFGDNIEDAMGHWKFLAFYLACGVAGGIAHALMLPTSRLQLIGGSGAMAGVISAYLVLHPRVRVWVLAFRFIPMQISAAWVLGLWACTQVCMALFSRGDQVASGAHVGGMIAGAVLIMFMRRPGVPLLDRAPATAVEASWPIPGHAVPSRPSELP